MLKSTTALLLFTTLISQSVMAADELEKRKQASIQASKTLVTELSSALKKEIEANGPAEAISVCRELAPAITGRISNANGWRMTRVSHRYRNALLGMPDAWEKSVLADFQKRQQAGEDLKTMAYSEVVTDASGDKYFRFMKAMPTGEICLTCHGSKDTIPQPVQDRLHTLYPLDQATGFKKGELRGAISIKQPMAVPLVNAGVVGE
jgi:hypothetical protein